MDFKNITGIYKIVNPNGLIYIGQSKNIENRLKKYRCKSCKDQPSLYKSILEYGFDNHKISLLKECSCLELNKWEKFFINKYKSHDPIFGLNLTTGGQDSFKFSDQVKPRLSNAQKGNKKTLGRKQTKEEIAKRIAKTTGQKRTKEQRERMSKAAIGKIVSEETKQKMSEASRYKTAKKVLDTASGIIYESCADAARAIGMNRSTLAAKLNGQNPNNTTLKYI